MRPIRSRLPGWARPRQWLRRYAPAEIAAVAGAVGGASLAALTWPGGAVSAVGGSVGETIAFYGFMLLRDLRAPGGPGPWRRRCGRTLRELAFEFGPAELVDTLAVRPLAMYLGEIALASTIGGVLVGKVAADVVFYGVAILSVELRRSLSTRDTPHPGEPAPDPVRVPAGES
jgi:hypothetical protein